MDGLGITSGSSRPAQRSSKREGRRWDTGKGKEASSEPATTYVVSKIDAGQAVLISDQVHCIEFPSILLPPGCTTGSVVSIACSRNFKEEKARNDEFWDLQDDILATYGNVSPTPPSLRLRNVTQTSVTLEWDKLQLATAKLLSLTIWRNGQRLAAIPNPLNNTSTKLSGLDVDANYSFHLIMKTTAGTFSSQTIRTRTLTLSDTSGIAVCFGTVVPSELLDEAKEALGLMKARWSNKIQIETTHFVCTQPGNLSPDHPSASTPSQPPSAASSDQPNAALEYQRALQLSIPVVHPSWVLACLREKKMVSISAHYLDKAVLSGNSSSVALSRKDSGRQSQSQSQQQQQQQQQQQAQQGPGAAAANPPPQVPAAQQRQPPIQLQNPPPPRNAAPLPQETHSETLASKAKGIEEETGSETVSTTAAAEATADLQDASQTATPDEQVKGAAPPAKAETSAEMETSQESDLSAEPKQPVEAEDPVEQEVPEVKPEASAISDVHSEHTEPKETEEPSVDAEKNGTEKPDETGVQDSQEVTTIPSTEDELRQEEKNGDGQETAPTVEGLSQEEQTEAATEPTAGDSQEAEAVAADVTPAADDGDDNDRQDETAVDGASEKAREDVAEEEKASEAGTMTGDDADDKKDTDSSLQQKKKRTKQKRKGKQQRGKGNA